MIHTLHALLHVAGHPGVHAYAHHILWLIHTHHAHMARLELHQLVWAWRHMHIA